MESSGRERVEELVEELTTSGQVELEEDKMKELKRICRGSDACIEHLYHLLMSQLNQDHAEIRLSAFQVARQLFSRSHHFRTLLVDNFQEFLVLTVETDVEQPLPPPKDVAKRLRTLAVQAVQSWQNSYGSAYKKLALGYHFLKQVKKVDFQDAEARTVAERRRDEDRRSRMERIYKAKVEAAANHMQESYQEIEWTLTELDSCMKLLLPEFGLADAQTASSCSQPERRRDDEQPCCSKNLEASDGDRGMLQKEESLGESSSTGREKKGGEKRSNTEGGDADEEGSAEDGRRGGEREMETGQGGGEREEGSSEEEEEEAGAEDVFIRNSGLISHSYSLDLDLRPGLHVTETEDNEPLVSTVIELHKLITSKHLPAVHGWVQVFTKAHAEEHLLRRALDLRRSLQAALQKHRELHIDYTSGRICKPTKASSEEDEDDFDEVPEKEGYEPHIPEHLRAEYGLDPSPSPSTPRLAPKNLPAHRAAPPPSSSSSSQSRRMKRLMEEEQDPTSATATLRLLRQKIPPPAEPGSSSSRAFSPPRPGSEETSQAPVVPFGLDLYYWGEEQPNAGKILKSTSQHQFWVPAEVEVEVENQELLEESRSRCISFPGTFVPVNHSCGAPLGSGRRCPRQDRVKVAGGGAGWAALLHLSISPSLRPQCPFHGRIVPRDQEGRPCREEDRRREAQEQRRRQEEQPDWRDADLMRDIEAATGEDLGSDRVGGKKRKKKRKYPNLSDLKQSGDTSRSRLERKLFNKKTMARIAQVMSKVDRRKHDKFSNQFNYALN